MKIPATHCTGNRPLAMYVDPMKLYLPAGTTPVAITAMSPEDTYIWSKLQYNRDVRSAGFAAQAVRIMDQGKVLEPLHPGPVATAQRVTFEFEITTALLAEAVVKYDAVSLTHALELLRADHPTLASWREI